MLRYWWIDVVKIFNSLHQIKLTYYKKMAQHIGIEFLDKNGKEILLSNFNFAPIFDLAEAEIEYDGKFFPLIGAIDPYSDTTYWGQDLEKLVVELESLKSDNMKLKTKIDQLVAKIKTLDAGCSIKFIGD